MAHVRISLFGSFEALVHQEPANGFRSDKVRALLAYLCIEAEQPHRREKLAGLLWPDLPERSARTYLRHALANLRRVLSDPSESDEPAGRAPFLEITRQTCQFHHRAGACVDVLTFLAALQATQDPLAHLEEAMALYRGELLEGFSLPDSTLFEEWLLLQRERFQRLALNALHRLVESYTLQGEYERALGYAWRQVEMDPLREGAHRQLMRLLAYARRASEALAQYESLCRVLTEELGTKPLSETAQLYEQIRDGTLPIPPPSKVRPPAFLTDEPPVVAEPPVFVARETELTRLGSFLELACAGRGGVALVVGEAGSGKTALLREFARRARETHPGVLITSGKGNTYTGAGDPYLPFRQALSLLTADVEGRWLAGAIDTSQALHIWRALPAAVGALVEAGPNLVGSLVPGQPLLDRARAFLRWSGDAAAGWVSRLGALASPQVAAPAATGPQQNDLFEQVTQVLHRLAQPEGLLLVLDDFQWADAGSIGLLFHLGRRLQRSRILVVFAYRPEELALPREGERHPLVPVIHELRREYGDVEVDLDRAGDREFLEALLDSEPNHLSAGFRDRLYAETAGHPLFTIELLRALQERGDLVQDPAGRWVEGPSLDWGMMPARTEAVIAERIGRLEAPLQEALRIASVLGEEFVAEVVAHVQGMDSESLLHQLSRKVDRQHRLVAARGIQHVDGQALSSYGFRHILYQQYLYEELDEVERAHLHGQAGRALEGLYEGHPEAMSEIAPQLARHFQTAGLPGRAATYFQQAGERALRMWANEEAIQHLTAGIDCLQTLPETPERMQQELSMQLALTAPLQATKGYAAPETGQAYARARELALHRSGGESPQLVQTLGLLGSYYYMRAECRTSLELYEQATAMSQRLGDALLVTMGHLGLGLVLSDMAEFGRALTHLEQVIEFYDPQQHRSMAFMVGQDIGASAHAWAAWTRWFMGYPDRALDHSRQAIALAKASEHPFSICFAHFIAGSMFHLLRRESRAVREHLKVVQSLAADEGFPLFQANSAILGGWLLAEEGQVETGIIQMREGLAAWQATGSQSHKAYYLGLLAEARGRAGEAEEGLQDIAQALDVVHHTGGRFYEAELHRLRGQLLVQGDAAGEAEVAACYRRAMDVASSQSARVLELRAATSLARLWQRQGRIDEARKLLAGIYGWFTEGFDTVDLVEAKALLEELG